VLAQQGFDEAKRALARLRSKPPHLLHVLVVAAQFLAHLGHVQRPGRDDVDGTQDDKQVAQCSANGARMASARRAMAAGKVMVDEL
jgi:hypothetical protein